MDTSMLSAKSLRGLEVVIGVLLLGILSGCASVNLIDWKRFRVPKASAKDPVTRIVGIWETAEGQGLDGKPTRGFAGQILFFTHGKASPVGVDGDVSIDLYDLVGKPVNGPVLDSIDASDPIHRFDFVGDAWTIHLTDSVLGPSYNVFIPYTRKHSWRANCGLRVKLKSNSGNTAFSEVVHVTLPGPVPAESQQAVDQRTGPQPVGPKINMAASLERRTVRPAMHQTAAAAGKLLPSAAEVVPASTFAAPTFDRQNQDTVFQKNLQQIEIMLNELKQQQQLGSPSPQPTAGERPAARRFQLQPAEKTGSPSSSEVP